MRKNWDWLRILFLKLDLTEILMHSKGRNIRTNTFRTTYTFDWQSYTNLATSGATLVDWFWWIGVVILFTNTICLGSGRRFQPTNVRLENPVNDFTSFYLTTVISIYDQRLYIGVVQNDRWSTSWTTRHTINSEIYLRLE